MHTQTQRSTVPAAHEFAPVLTGPLSAAESCTQRLCKTIFIMLNDIGLSIYGT